MSKTKGLIRAGKKYHLIPKPQHSTMEQIPSDELSPDLVPSPVIDSVKKGRVPPLVFSTDIFQRPDISIKNCKLF